MFHNLCSTLIVGTSGADGYNFVDLIYLNKLSKMFSFTKVVKFSFTTRLVDKPASIFLDAATRPLFLANFRALLGIFYEFVAIFHLLQEEVFPIYVTRRPNTLTFTVSSVTLIDFFYLTIKCFSKKHFSTSFS